MPSLDADKKQVEVQSLNVDKKDVNGVPDVAVKG